MLAVVLDIHLVNAILSISPIRLVFSTPQFGLIGSVAYDLNYQDTLDWRTDMGTSSRI